MRLGYFTVGLPEYTPEQAVELLRDAGYEGIEWRVTEQSPSADGKPGFWAGNNCTWSLNSFEQDAPRIRELSAAAGLEIPNIGTYVTCDQLDLVEQAMRGCIAVGSPQLRVNVSRYNPQESYLIARDRSRANYREVAALAKHYGVRAIIEIHHGSLIPSASAAAAFLAGFDPRYVGAIHDAGNMVYEGYEDYRMGFELLGPYLAHIHLKNAKWEQHNGTWRVTWAPFRTGVVDMAALINTIKQIGYDGWITFEDFSTEQSTAERVVDNLAYVKSLIG